MTGKDQNDEPLNGEIMPPEDEDPPHGDGAETFTGKLSATSKIINEISEIALALPEKYRWERNALNVCVRALHMEHVASQERLQGAKRKISALKSDLRHTTEQLSMLKSKMWGESSEKGREAIEDDDSDLADIPDFELEETEKKKGRGVAKLPDDLERRHVDHFPPERHCPCGREMKSIGVETRERLVTIPERQVVEVHHYHTCACNRTICKENKPMSAKADRYIMRGRKADLDTVIEYSLQKFYEAKTVYRQERRLLDAGCNVTRQHLGRLTTHLAGFLEPVCDEIWKHATAGHSAMMDETPLRVQAEGKCEQGYLWAICRDERGWNPDARPAVYFRYAPSRGGQVAKEMLEGALIDTLQTDGYAGYNGVRHAPGQNDGVDIQRCMAHARRQFTDAQKVAPSTLAKRVLKRIGGIYAVENRAKGLPPAQREAMRFAEALPALKAIREELLKAEPDLPKGKLKNAANYFLNAWEDLIRYVFNGRLEIDNNPVERCMRLIGVTRKNSLFAGSHAAAENWAIFYTLIETARLNDVDPFKYVRWVVGEIEKGRELTDYSRLMPWDYKAAAPALANPPKKAA